MNDCPLGLVRLPDATITGYFDGDDNETVFLASGTGVTFLAHPEDKVFDDAQLREAVNRDPGANTFLRSLAKNYALSFPNPEDADIRYLPPFAPVESRVVLDAKDLIGLTINSSRRAVDVTLAGDAYRSFFVPGPVETIVSFMTSDLNIRPGQTITINLPDDLGQQSFIIDSVHLDRFGDTVEVKGHGINTRLTQSKERTTMAPKNEKRAKFYVGSKKVTTPDFKGETWAKYTEKEAIEHATRLLEQTGEEQFIVKVIKVVKRKPQPIVVETVK